MGLRWAHLVAGYDQRPWKQHGKIPKEAEFHGPCSAGWTNILHRPRFWHIFMLAMGMVQHTATKMGSFNKDYPKICRSRFWFFRWLVNDAEGAFGATCAGGCQSRGELLFFFSQGKQSIREQNLSMLNHAEIIVPKLGGYWWTVKTMAILMVSLPSTVWQQPALERPDLQRRSFFETRYSHWTIFKLLIFRWCCYNKIPIDLFFSLNHKLSAISSY